MLAKIPKKYLDMLDNTAYADMLDRDEFITCNLSLENQMWLEMYDLVIDPTNQSIDWSAYHLIAEMDGYPEPENYRTIILHYRNVLAEYREKVSERDSKDKHNNINDEDNKRIRRIGD